MPAVWSIVFVSWYQSLLLVNAAEIDGFVLLRW